MMRAGFSRSKRQPCNVPDRQGPAIALTELIQRELPAGRSRPMLLSPPAEKEPPGSCYAMS